MLLHISLMPEDAPAVGKPYGVNAMDNRAGVAVLPNGSGDSVYIFGTPEQLRALGAALVERADEAATMIADASRAVPAEPVHA